MSSVSYKLMDVTISEISLSDLRGIENVLLRQNQCDALPRAPPPNQVCSPIPKNRRAPRLVASVNLQETELARVPPSLAFKLRINSPPSENVLF